MNKILKNLLLFSILLTSVSVFSQGTQAGSWPPDYEVLQKCVDSANLGTNYISYYEVQIHRAGQTLIINSYRSNGSSFTPPSGTITMGSCPASVSIVKDSIRDVEVIAMCDDVGAGAVNPFWRIIMRSYWPTTGAGATTILGNISKTGASYTPGATVYDGPCAGYNFTTEVREEITINKTYASTYESWSVSNVGMTTFTISVAGGAAANLYPGEIAECKGKYDEHKRLIGSCSPVVVNASGGTAHVYTRVKL